MGDTTIQFYSIAGASTCESTGLAYAVLGPGADSRTNPLFARVVITNEGVAQDQSGPLPSGTNRPQSTTRTKTTTGKTPPTTPPVLTSSPPVLPPDPPPFTSSDPPPIFSNSFSGLPPIATDPPTDPQRLRPGRPSSYGARRTRQEPPHITRSLEHIPFTADGSVPWKVDVPEGFYVVTAILDGDNPNVHIVASPRFYVDKGSDTSCIGSLSDAPLFSSTTTSLGPTNTNTGAVGQGPTPDKPHLPVAAIVGISITAVVLLVILALVCVWNKRQNRAASPPSSTAEMRMNAKRASVASSFYNQDRGSGAWYTTRATRAGYGDTS